MSAAELQAVADDLIDPAWCSDGLTPPAGVALGVAHAARVCIAVAGLRGTPDRPVTADTRWDVASVTKLVTTTVCIGLVSSGTLDLDRPVDQWLPELAGLGITAESLLRHRSGLLPWQPLDLAGIGADAAMATIASLPMGTPGEFAYSDLGMISLGVLLTRSTGRTLPELVQEWINEPLEVDLRYGPVDEPVADSAPDDRVERRMFDTGQPYPILLDGPAPRWRDTPYRGEVHDGNARRTLGGISAHAGIFATVADLLAVGRALADPAPPASWRPEVLHRFLTEPLGFRTRQLADGTQLHHHPGFTGCALGFVAGSDRAYALCANRWMTEAEPVSTEQLWSRFLQEVAR
ncbi:beta-lactamase family protein [Naumannella sp. ID2617S]|nr:beta-lactamase family protein [Naumannella sp. ID2617S]